MTNEGPNKMEEKKKQNKTNIKFHVLAIFCILIFSFALTPITFQNDTYYTISIGEHIIQNGYEKVRQNLTWSNCADWILLAAMQNF